MEFTRAVAAAALMTEQAETLSWGTPNGNGTPSSESCISSEGSLICLSTSASL